MEAVATESIRYGMMLGKTVTSGGRVLLKAGTILRESYIPILLRQGVSVVHVTRTVAMSPVGAVSSPTHTALTAQLGGVLEQISALFDAASARYASRFSITLDVPAITQTVGQMVDELLSNPRVVFNLHDIGASDEYTLRHSVNVCILTTLLGIEVGYNPIQLKQLATGALLHDVGKVGVPPEVLNKPGKLTPEEFKIMASHTTIGWRILREQEGIPYAAAVIALQHHERFSGGGYPRGLKGEQIHPNARLCTVADCFEALTSDRVYRKALSPACALDVMARDMSTAFEPGLVERFRGCVTPYPVGSVVELSDGQMAVVFEVARGKTYRPKVHPLDSDGDIQEGRVIDLDLDQYRAVSVARLIRWAATAFAPEVSA